MVQGRKTQRQRQEERYQKFKDFMARFNDNLPIPYERILTLLDSPNNEVNSWIQWGFPVLEYMTNEKDQYSLKQYEALWFFCLVHTVKDYYHLALQKVCADYMWRNFKEPAKERFMMHAHSFVNIVPCSQCRANLRLALGILVLSCPLNDTNALYDLFRTDQVVKFIDGSYLKFPKSLDIIGWFEKDPSSPIMIIHLFQKVKDTAHTVYNFDSVDCGIEDEHQIKKCADGYEADFYYGGIGSFVDYLRWINTRIEMTRPQTQIQKRQLQQQLQQQRQRKDWHNFLWKEIFQFFQEESFHSVTEDIYALHLHRERDRGSKYNQQIITSASDYEAKMRKDELQRLTTIEKRPSRYIRREFPSGFAPAPQREKKIRFDQNATLHEYPRL